MLGTGNGLNFTRGGEKSASGHYKHQTGDDAFPVLSKGQHFLLDLALR
jgi:hypothetical protein